MIQGINQFNYYPNNVYTPVYTQPIVANPQIKSIQDTDNSAIFNQIKTKLDSAKTIVIYPHKNPDSDAIASSLLLKKSIKQLYPDKTVDVVINDKIPYELKLLHNLDENALKDSKTPVANYDVAFALDMSAPDILPDIKGYNNSKFKVNIDHHKSNKKNFADVSLVDTSSSSTSQVLYEKFLKNFPNLNVTQDIARDVMVGVLTDTAELTNKNVNQGTYMTINELVNRANINFNKVYNDVKSSANIQAADLPMYFNIMNGVKKQGKLAYTVVEDKYMDNNISAKKVINRTIDDMLKPADVDISAVFYKTTDGTKVVFRSKQTDVSNIATKLGGGGHEHSAGTTINKPVDEAISEVLNLV